MSVSAPERPVAAGAPAARRAGSGRWLLGALVPLALLAAWQLSSSLGVFTVFQLPPPADVAGAAQEMWRTGALQLNIAISTQRVLLGFLWGAGLGVVLGGLTGLLAVASRMLGPTIGALRAVPSLAWVPLLSLWIGIGETPKIVLVAIGAFFPVYTTVHSALSHLDPALVEVGRAYGRNGVRLFTEILLPATAPSLVSGLRLALAQSWLFLVAAEIISSSIGLGYQLTNGQNVGRTDQMLLAIILLALLGKLSDVLLGLVEQRVKRNRS
ncbi:ABC transporter permease [Paenibacillus sp. TRM 82003]|uniref:ABC transporter permease n=1 Tax=Kineococcus sp. TRM81007 TaxID=2925831 RepID=UPI001F5AB353|nr:ABC transporter permease [Kineococcus sp. TRM81007]MCI2240117.1 ABC transporter permease [Kineococcus sp. TRM81007]MCI3925577.1 ABC transporter permease [Paenibacillus sp. TRM 82003]